MNFSYFFNQQVQQNQTPVSIHHKTQQSLLMPQSLAKSKKNAKVNPFSWKSAESKKYISFLKKNTHLMSLPVEERKRIRINVIMSQYVKSKNPEQCRSHHQKMVLKYGSIQGIIDSHASKKSASREAQCHGRIEDNKAAETSQYKSQATEQPFWHQYLTIFSQEQSRDYVANEEMPF